MKKREEGKSRKREKERERDRGETYCIHDFRKRGKEM